MIKYMNYSSDFKDQLKIGIENLTDASIPVEYNEYTGLANTLKDICIKEMNENMNGYYSTYLKENTHMYISLRSLTDEPAYKIPQEFEDILKENEEELEM